LPKCHIGMAMTFINYDSARPRGAGGVGYLVAGVK